MGSSETHDPLNSNKLVVIPAIDFSHPELKPGNAAIWDSVKVQVRQALVEFGCFEATFGKITPGLRNAILESGKQVFDLPLETKLKILPRKPYTGYINHPFPPIKESFPIHDALVLEEAQRFTNLLWPQGGNPLFCNTDRSFSEQLSELDRMIRRMLLESFGLEKYMDEHFGSTMDLLRVMKYKAPETTTNDHDHEDKLVLHSHTDKNYLTILYQNHVHGIEVQIRSNDEWIKLKPSPETFVVMIGDTFHAWTNGQLHPTYHRVTMRTGSDDRYSLAQFSISKDGYIIQSPEELVDEGHPLLYKPYDQFEFLDFYRSEAGQKSQSPLKTFCGAV